jgi:hypothetical protein
MNISIIYIIKFLFKELDGRRQCIWHVIAEAKQPLQTPVIG